MGPTATRGVLRARLLPPPAPSPCLPRPHLVERVAGAMRDGTLVSIAAGPGYGKTTLLVRALERAGAPAAWCSCDARMRCTEALACHLAAALAGAAPGLDVDLAPHASPLEMAGELCAALAETAPPGLVLALDQVDLLTGHPGGELLRALARDLPPGIALALAGRGGPPIALARLRAAGLLCELGAAELALSEEEGLELLRSAAPELEPGPGAELYRRSEGLAAALALAGHALGAGIPSEQLVFEYLDEEVFAPLPQATRDFLLETSILERLTAESAGALSGRDDAGAILERLVRDGVLTARLPDGAGRYRYHGLLGEFLRHRLAAARSRRPAELHRQAGAFWLTAAEHVEAAKHYLEAGATAAAADALAPAAEAMATGPEAELLAGWLERIGAEGVAARPALVLATALLDARRDTPDRALQSLRTAADALVAAGDHERAATALARIGTLECRAGERREAIAAARAALASVAPQAPPTLAAARVGLAVQLGAAGRHDEAAAELMEAASTTAAAASPGIQAAAMIAQAMAVEYPAGRGEAALDVLDGALGDAAAAQRAVPGLPSPGDCRALVLNRLGRHDEALAELGGPASGLGGTWAGMATLERLEALSALGRWGALRTLLARLEHGRSGSPAGSRYHVARARLAAHEGDPAALAVHLEAAREAVRGDGPTLEAALVLADLALAAGEGGALPIARAMAERARSEAEAVGAPLGIARAARAGAAVESRAASPQAGGGRAARGRRTAAAAERTPFRLVTLGRFALLRGTAERGPVRFERRKAPALLVALACAGEPLHREQLQEWFWPELPPARGLNALHTTLHTLRRALDPHLARGAASSSLVNEGQAYRLHWGVTDSWDAAEFLRLAREAEEPCAPDVRIARLRAAEDAHVGRFLPDWPDADWSRSCRTRVEDAYHGTLERLADALLEAGRAAEAIERYRRLVAIDPDREGWHRGLMRSLARFGQRELALRQYEVCRLQLRRAHGAEPGPETRKLRDSLLAGGGGRGPRPAHAL